MDVRFWCRNGHTTVLWFSSAEATVLPDVWDCPHCDLPAGRDQSNLPTAQRVQPFKTHLAYAKERRTPEEGEAILAEALAALRSRAGH